MIITVTANPALDITYSVAELDWNAAHRVARVHRQAGGKGINVARTLTTMGVGVLALGLVGGLSGTFIRNDLEAAGIAPDLVEAQGGESRMTVVIRAADGRSLELDELGTAVTSAEWTTFAERFESLLRPGALVALSGSLPQGVADDAYRLLIERSAAAGARVILDTSGPALAEALPARPDVVKPNRAELETLLGEPCDSSEAVLEGCRRLLSLGARSVVASLGERGALAVDGESACWLTHPARNGNAVGAGDTLVAGMAAALEAGKSFFEAASNGVRWAYASLASPFAGWIEPAEVCRQKDVVEIHAVAPRIGSS